jgi:plastocyanin
MMRSILFTLVPLAFAQQTHVVTVGAGGKDVFEPDTVTAAVGDKVQFNFAFLGHSVSASAFDGPCKPVADTTFFSGDGEVVSSLIFKPLL